MSWSNADGWESSAAYSQGHLLFYFVVLPSVSDSQGPLGVDIKLTDRS